MEKRTEQRSLKSLQHTIRYVNQYQGLPILLSLMVLFNCYVLAIAHFYMNSRSQTQFEILLLATTGLIALVGGAIVVTGVLAAHKVAGVHLRMEKVFDQIREGNLDTTLKLRDSDNLESLENSFNLMMSYLKQRAK